jgi:hypothetical protein
VLGTKEPRQNGDQAEKRDGDEELALHRRASEMANDTKSDRVSMQ